MSNRTSNFFFLVGGLGLYVVGAKVFADYHENVATGKHDDFQHRYATAIGTGATIAGLGMAIYGTYKINPSWGKGLGLALGGLVAYNAYKHKQGEPLISLSPFKPPMALHAGV